MYLLTILPMAKGVQEGLFLRIEAIVKRKIFNFSFNNSFNPKVFSNTLFCEAKTVSKYIKWELHPIKTHILSSLPKPL
jgi:hypothetical protein